MVRFHDTQAQTTAKAAAVLSLPAVHSVQDNVFRRLRQREEERINQHVKLIPERPLRDRVANYLFSWSRNAIQPPRRAVQ